MNNKKRGLEIENDIVEHINTRKFIEKMNPNIKLFLKHIFKIDLSNKEIQAGKYYDNYKPDITITVSGITKYISIKSGTNNSIHQEHLYSFINFLKLSAGFADNYIENLKLFHFNDGTVNGSGTSFRNSAIDFQINNQDKIQEINNALNNKKYILEIIDRLLFKGEYHNIPIVDYLYYGSLEHGLWASRKEILIFLAKKFFYSTSPHISKLYYQSLHRNLKKDLHYEHKRYYVQFKWHSIKEDLEYISTSRKKQ